MSKKQLIYLAACLLGAVSTIGILYAMSPLSKPIYRGNFMRYFPMATYIRQMEALDIEYNSFYFAGSKNGTIYLGNSTAPFHLLKVSTLLKDTSHVRLGISGLDSVKNPTEFRLAVDSPNFFLMHGSMPNIFMGTLENPIAKETPKHQSEYFSDAIPINKNSFIFKSYSLASKGYEIGKSNEKGEFKFYDSILQKQIDGVFCVDGQMLFNGKDKILVYLYYYRNEFIVSDSNLNIKYRGHTIDSFSRARVKVKQINHSNESMLAAPPAQINVRAAVYKKYLLVQSNILSLNENLERFINGFVVDIYDLSSGKYLHSINIEYYKKQHPSSFIVQDDSLYVLFGQYLVKYALPNEVLI